MSSSNWVSENELYDIFEEKVGVSEAENLYSIPTCGYGFNASHFVKQANELSEYTDIGIKFHSVREKEDETIEWLISHRNQ